MKHLVLTSVAVAALLLSGCSKKNPEMDGSAMGESSLASRIQSEVSNVYFDYDKFNIRADQQGSINNNAALFNQAGAEALTIKIEGNCDEWGSDQYNYALGLKRAKAAKDALVKQGVSADRISVVSYGESNLVCTSKTKECDAQNRRDEFKVGF
ncbi:MAG: OmpA family protein [Campylobacter sp.]|nr:OmpA family protein [Campylobacter sp.]MBQ7271261.1 OmpA family protein [Campylobacter sp.]MBQ7675135.1 OmpA family protein [Campylobacter sp.]MBR0071204.1 OmpA family protein [Campylobacter sp.]